MNTEPSNTHPDQPNDTVPTPASDRRALLAGIGGLAAGAMLLGSRTAQAGPLNPPSGPVASTGKTLTEVEPRIAINATNTPGSSATSSVFRITQPGSYYLTGNIISTTINRHVIVVAASGVTIDLNGFVVRGLGTVQGDFDCIFAETGVDRAVVRNGHVELAGRNGINFATADGCAIDGVRASTCVAGGLRAGARAVVTNCAAVRNSGVGINTGAGCTVSNCTASNNSDFGFTVSNGCTVTNCSVYLNGGSGINAGAGTVSNCSAYNNTGNGIDAGDGSTVADCSASNNTGIGIVASDGSTVTNCSAYNNIINGIRVLSGGTVTNCSAYLNGGSGISVSPASTVSNCSAYNNTGNGISAGGGSTVADCTIRFSTLDGILCSTLCVIRGNTCSDNANGGNGAGIHATGTDNRIEGNTCTGADRGIDVDAAGNIIIRNTCSGNTTNWTIAANNYYGPIIDRTGVATAAVNGNSAADTSGTTHPHANFTY